MEPGARTSSETVAATPLHHTVRTKAESCGRSAMSTYIQGAKQKRGYVQHSECTPGAMINCNCNVKFTSQWASSQKMKASEIQHTMQ